MSEFAIVGAGALGCVLASWLTEAGLDVVLCSRRPLTEITIDTDAGDTTITPVKVATDPAELSSTKFVLVTTKAQDTASTQPWLERLVDESSVVVPIQNGVEHRDRLKGLISRDQVLPCIAWISAERLADGHVRKHAGDLLVVAPGLNAEAFAASASTAKLRIRIDEDFTTTAWRKLLSNIATNGITALTLRRVDVFDDPQVRQLAIRLLDEAVMVGIAEGALLTQDDHDEVTGMWSRLPKGNGSSMLYDRLAGRRLEHDHITGAVVRAADRHNLDVPTNLTLLALLKGLDDGIGLQANVAQELVSTTSP